MTFSESLESSHPQFPLLKNGDNIAYLPAHAIQGLNENIWEDTFPLNSSNYCKDLAKGESGHSFARVVLACSASAFARLQLSVHKSLPPPSPYLGFPVLLFT